MISQDTVKIPKLRINREGLPWMGYYIFLHVYLKAISHFMAVNLGKLL